MKTIFVINPKAGNGKCVENLKKSIKASAEHLKAEVEIYITKAVGDAKKYVEEHCNTKGRARFIACGGDGTLSEVLNGAIGCDGVEIGVMPIGTGNDFCRNFLGTGNFLNAISQISGESVKCDAIRYHTYLEGAEKTGFCANMFNIGFDCNVADMTNTIKSKSVILGSFAYVISIFTTLIKKKGANLKIELDGNVKHKGKLLLTSIANGSFCGGGIMSNPLADVNDGFINLNIIKNVSRLRLLTLLPKYMKGTHIRMKNIENIILNSRCKKIIVTPQSGTMRICIDGEITDAGMTEFSIVHNAFDFVIPNEVIAKECITKKAYSI